MHSMVVVLRRRRAGLVLAVAPIAAILLFVGIQSSRASGPLPQVGWSQGPDLPAGFDPRWDFAYGYYPPTGEVVLFGGAPRQIGDVWRNDTWIFDGAGWRQGPAAPPGLTPRGGASMAYLPSAQQLVMFGGADGSWPAKKETWLWNGSSWTAGPSAPAAMHGRTGALMAYLPELGKIVLFAGSDDDIVPDVWFFDGSFWTPGPAVPGPVLNRAFAGMAYDPNLRQLVIAGGDGTTDVWYFDGSTFTPGPELPMGARERFRMEYDPQLGGVVMFGGLGPGVGHDDFWLLRAGQWLQVTPWSDHAYPDGQRSDGGLVWLPSQDAMVMFSGIVAMAGTEQEGYADTWFFREVAPSVASVALDPPAPNMADAISIVKGATQDGYKSWSFEYAWFKNGVQIAGVVDSKLDPTEATYVHGDSIVGKVRVTDDLGIAGPWVASPAVTIVNRAPSIKNVKIVQTKVYTSMTASASGTPSDPDGDTVTQHYTWKVNGVVVPNNDLPTLTPSHFVAGDSVTVTIKPVDQLGLAGPTQTSPAKVVVWNITAVSATPGSTKTVKAYAFSPNEMVDIRLDSPTGQVLGSAAADATGLASAPSAIPSPLAGGAHMLYGVGRTSGTVGPGQLTVTASGDLSPASVGAGDTTVFTGQGFGANEFVTVKFPHGQSMPGQANGAGTLAVSLTASQEPSPGGNVTITGPSSGTVTDAYTTKAVLTAPAENKPGDMVPVTVTGFGASESVTLKLDTATVATVATNPVGTWSGSVKMQPYFGSHVLTATGLTSGVSKTATMDFDAWVKLTPSNGPVGTVVQVSSGPGWVPNSQAHVFWRSQNVGNPKAGAYGWVLFSFPIPDGTAGTSYPVKVTDDALGLSATANFLVGSTGNNPPSVSSVTLSPTKAYPTTPITAQANGVSDPEGDPVTLHYAWTVNGNPVAGYDNAVLTTDRFTGNDSVVVSVTPTDSKGASGTPVASNPKVVSWNISAISGYPGQSKALNAFGFTPGETVDFRMDSPTGPVMWTYVADSSGEVHQTITLPAPFPGGPHMLYAKGRTSSLVGPGPLTVTPVADWTPVNVAAGDSGTYSAMGFKPNELVSVSFPHGTPTNQQADANGSVTVTLTSPQEPAGSANVTGTAQSGSAGDNFTPVAKFTITGGGPGLPVPMMITGYGANESVKVTLETGAVVGTFQANAVGTVSVSPVVITVWGSHTFTALGLTSGITKTANVNWAATMSVTPPSGPVGTVVTIDSGPGWVPNSTVHLKWKNAQAKDVIADATGTVHTIYTIPQSSPGTFQLKLTDDVLLKTASANFTVTSLGPAPGQGLVGRLEWLR